MAKSSAAPAQLEKLKELAEKATPGPWKTVDCRHQQNGQVRLFGGNYNVTQLANVLAKNPNCETDSQFIAAANPKAILEILAAHQALYEALSAARDGLLAVRQYVLPHLPQQLSQVRDFHEEIEKATAALALADAAQEREAQ